MADDLPPGVERGKPWDDPRLMIGWDEGRAGSPYTFEGRLARSANALNSLSSSDPYFRRRARRRMALLLAISLLPIVLSLVLFLRS